MADPRFFKKEGPFKLSELAKLAECELQDTSCADIIINDVVGLDEATKDDISWAFVPSVRKNLEASKAGACITNKQFMQYVPSGMAVLLSNDPHRSYGLVAQAFYPQKQKAEISPKAFIEDTAQIGEGCRIDAGAFVGKGVKLGRNCWVQANAVIQEKVEMGNDCIVGANATVGYCLAGHKVYIYPGAQVGQDGFGFAMGAKGATKVPQLGRVIIGNDVEIGSNTTVDRGAMGDTIIGDGCRIDNLVQVAHNVKLGQYCILVSQTGIAGSCEFGDFVVAAGQSGFAGHLKIATGTQIGAQSGVMRDTTSGQVIMGSPAEPHLDWMRKNVLFQKMLQESKTKKEKNNE